MDEDNKPKLDQVNLIKFPIKESEEMATCFEPPYVRFPDKNGFSETDPKHAWYCEGKRNMVYFPKIIGVNA